MDTIVNDFEKLKAAWAGRDHVGAWNTAIDIIEALIETVADLEKRIGVPTAPPAPPAAQA